jgi:hypothetical protein
MNSSRKVLQKPTDEERVPSGYVTRNMIKEITGLSEQGLKRLEALGIVRPVSKNETGWFLYPDTIIDKISNRGYAKTNSTNRPTKVVYTNKESSAVLKLLMANKSLPEIAVETNVTLDTVLQIQKDYFSVTNQMVISKEILDKINELPVDGVFPLKDENELYNLLVELTKEPKCNKCGLKPKGLCTACARESIMRLIKKQFARAQAAQLALQEQQQKEKTAIEQMPEAEIIKSNDED